MSENEPKGQEPMNEDGRDQLHLTPDEDGHPRMVWVKPNPKFQCGNCNNRLEPGDKYCRICGTKRGEGAYEPYLDTLEVQCVYGPMPKERTHICPQCGYSWRICLMIDNQDYCPMCGNRAYIDQPPQPPVYL